MRLVILLFSIIFACQSIAEETFLSRIFGSGYKAYLNVEDGQYASVFTKPGKDWATCEKDPECKAVAWPDNQSDIEVLSGVKKMNVYNERTEQEEEEEYVRVRVKYTRKTIERANEVVVIDPKTKKKIVKKQLGAFTIHEVEEEGWMDNAYLSREKVKTFYGTDPAESADKVTGSCRRRDYSSPQKLAENAKAIERHVFNQGIVSAAEAIKPAIGMCTINPKIKIQNYGEGNPYDKYVLPKVSRAPVPNIKKENGQPMTSEDLVTIDALSRTLYAEMARCYKHGLQYPMTVAKISVNRSEMTSRHREFIKGKHEDEKTDLAKVVTSPSQFSLWLKTINGKQNNSLRQALCPPIEKKADFWNGHKPSQQELDIWNDTVKIATEAVLYPKKFGNRTEEVKQYFYTSGLPKFFNMTQVKTSVQDRKTSKEACIQVWQERKKSG